MHQLEEKLGVVFENKAVLKQALTHSSTGNKAHYERMEFLGDRVLNLAVADILYKTFPKEGEGVLAKRHAALVRQDALAKVAEMLDIAPLIHFSAGEKRSGGRNKPSILADVVEAILAAVYLEFDYATAKAIVVKYWTNMIHTVELKDAKSHLQEYLQGMGEPLPVYESVAEEGEAHKMTFTMRAVTEKHGSAEGTGASKQQAEQNAAKQLLIALGETEA